MHNVPHSESPINSRYFSSSNNLLQTSSVHTVHSIHYLSGEQEPGGAVLTEVEGAVVSLRVCAILLGTQTSTQRVQTHRLAVSGICDRYLQ